MGRAEGTVRLRKRSLTLSTASLPRVLHSTMPLPMCLVQYKDHSAQSDSGRRIAFHGISALGPDPRQGPSQAPQGEQQMGAVLALVEDTCERGRWMRTFWRC
jgi:hypothetical protein